MNNFSHYHWINEIRRLLKNGNNVSDEDIVKFSLSYTLQSLKYGEDFDRFKWDV